MAREVGESFLEGKGLNIIAIVLGVTFLTLAFIFGISTERQISLSPPTERSVFVGSGWPDTFIFDSAKLSASGGYTTPWNWTFRGTANRSLSLNFDSEAYGIPAPIQFPVEYGDGTKWVGTGSNAGGANYLASSSIRTLFFNYTKGDRHFVASSGGESYMLWVDAIKVLNGKNVITLLDEEAGGGEICETSPITHEETCHPIGYCENKSVGESCTYGKVTLTVNDVVINGGNKWFYVSINEGGSFNRLYDGQGNYLGLPAADNRFPVESADPRELFGSIYGDLNNDAFVNGTDIDLANNILLNPATTPESHSCLFKAIDLDGNGVFNSDDRNSLVDYVVGRIARFPVEEAGALIPSFTYGDLNNDGVVDINDNESIIGIILNRVPIPARSSCLSKSADVDGNGGVTMEDINLLADKILGRISSFPIENFSYGDVNNDGIVNQTDLEALSDIILMRVPMPSIDSLTFRAADVDYDGTLTMEDLNLIVNRVLGRQLIESYQPHFYIADDIKFSGDTTLIFDPGVGEVINNFTLENRNGIIQFTNDTNISNIINDPLRAYAGVFMTSNKIKVDTAVLPELANVSAKITFKNVAFRHPRVKRDGSLCSSDVCRNLRKSGSNYSIEISNFSEYILEEGPSVCGDGYCDGGETYSTCVTDCGGTSGTTPVTIIEPSGGSRCVPRWNCTWSSCINGLETRTCIKLNPRCPFNDSLPAPPETRACLSPTNCTAMWSCNWGDCINREQVRTCVKTNPTCADNSGMPGTARRSCGAKRDYSWLWWVIPIIILAAAIVVGAILFARYLKRRKETVVTPISKVPVTASSEAEMNAKAKALVSQFKQRGYSEKDIRDAFKEKGWNDRDVDSLLKK